MAKKKAVATFSKFSTFQWQVMIMDSEGEPLTDFLVGGFDEIQPGAKKWGKENGYEVGMMTDQKVAEELVKVVKKNEKDGIDAKDSEPKPDPTIPESEKVMTPEEEEAWQKMIAEETLENKKRAEAGMEPMAKVNPSDDPAKE